MDIELIIAFFLRPWVENQSDSTSVSWELAPNQILVADFLWSLQGSFFVSGVMKGLDPTKLSGNGSAL
jgi:hypothetical protein